MKIIGREKEIKELLSLYDSNKPELVAIYGRRRVGKTYLVNMLFEDKFTFKHTALSPINSNGSKITTKDQIDYFIRSLKKYGYVGNSVINNWFDAFSALENLLEKNNDSRQLIFFDELPWLDTPKSKFINAFEGFYNGWASAKNIIVIICGSATSWIVNNFVDSYGGLYNRLTREISLQPFSLKECELLFNENGILLSRYDIALSYMIFGGIPYYLNSFQRGLTLAQNVNSLLFSKKAMFKNEYKRLFSSEFKSPKITSDVVMFLNTKKIGYTRKEIAKYIGGDGEQLKAVLNALVSGDFVVKYKMRDDNGITSYYKLIDPFCLFYLKFKDNNTSLNNDFFSSIINSSQFNSWKGLAFENLCFNHIDQIKASINILGTPSNNYPFVYKDKNDSGAQIDLVIDRKDNVVNLCECKFYSDEFTSDKDNHLNLIRKSEVLKKYILKKQIIHPTLITTYGLQNNSYFSDYYKVIILDDLFN